MTVYSIEPVKCDVLNCHPLYKNENGMGPVNMTIIVTRYARMKPAWDRLIEI